MWRRIRRFRREPRSNRDCATYRAAPHTGRYVLQTHIYQNAKQEAFWGPVEGRLVAMLEHVPDLTLAFLNEATQAWVEHEYNRSVHSEIAATPLARFLEGPAVTRPCPGSVALRLAFTRSVTRTQKKSDGSIVIDGRRFELPNRYRHLDRVEVRYAEWDLSAVHLVDERTGNVLARLYPQDRTQNASGLRRSLEPLGPPPSEPAHTARIAHPAAVAAPARRAVERRASARLSPQGRGRRRGLMNRKMLALYGLKWNPFAPDVPVEALHVSRRIESFCWRAEQLVGEGGFALVTGAPGVGKSVTLRILADRLEARRDVKVGIISRPQSGLSDFYREMGDLFGVELSPHNRWAGAKVLRDRWQAHIDAALSRPVLIADEAQEMKAAVLAELRLLSSARLDSQVLLTVVLAGDGRLLQRLRSDELSALNSRCRVRLALERATPDELAELLVHALQEAGAAKLMTPELIATLADHAQGNPRALMNIAAELLDGAAQREARHIDEKLFLEMCAAPPPPEARPARQRTMSR